MSYASAVEHLYGLSGELAVAPGAKPRRKFDLNHMRVLMAALGDPQAQFPSVLIAGTNGKGSTAATLASICGVAGYKTGLYTSPHLIRVNERIQISSGASGGNTLAEIDDDIFARLYFQVDDAANQLVSQGKLPQPPSFFEVMTALAFLAFAGSSIDIAVLEVGLGGRLDATNIVEPKLSILTDIGLDHTEWLGNTITEIAREKAGILRPGGTLITLPQHLEANAAIGEVAMELGVTGVNAAAYLPGRAAGSGPYLIQVGAETVTIDSPLAGEHQRRNIALAIAAAHQLAAAFPNITPHAIADGIRQTRWSGRLQAVARPGGGTILLDVAHNPDGMWTLRSYLSWQIESGQLAGPCTLVFSALREKAIHEMAQILFPLFEEEGGHILLAPVQNARAASPEQLLAAATQTQSHAQMCDSVPDAMARALRGTGSIVISGSVYLVGEASAWLAEQSRL